MRTQILHRHAEQPSSAALSQFASSAPVPSRRLRPHTAASHTNKDAALLNALTIIVHDLRGPLANLSILLELIATYTQMQAYDRLEGSTRKAQEVIERLDGMIHGFLQRARETGDPLSFRPALIDLADVVRAVAGQNESIAESREITIDVACATVCVVSGDQRLLMEAVDNLVTNAVKYAPTGSVVRCEVAVEQQNAVIRIRDEGQGLGADDLKRGFQPFTALSPRLDAMGTSWGLGLWIVRLIAERHGGFVDVATPSAVAGTTFTLHLPFGLHRPLKMT